jgi:acyl-CoA hydrolase/GNAT superfamily N-acetyltransferase
MFARVRSASQPVDGTTPARCGSEMLAKTPWQLRYSRKVATAPAAVRRIRPGQRIFIGSGAAEPATLVSALVSDGDHLADNEVVHILTLGPAPYVEPRFERRFRHVAFFIGANVREAVQSGRADFVPVFLSEVPRLLSSARARVAVALVQVSPPDDDGYVSLGVSVDVVRAAVDAATLVVAEVNPRMPRTRGASLLHVDRFAALVPVDYELPEAEAAPLDEVSRAIGRNVATLVSDGATLQLGIGGVPDAVLAALEDRRDLGVHSEMISDGVMRLARAGVMTGRRKTHRPGKIVTSFVLGSRELYRWADDNPALELLPSDITNDPGIIAANDQMVAINGALAVDLTGQVAADTVGGKFFSGIGGQVDFIRGAAQSRGGKPIIALRSTARRGQVSRIQPAFDAGAGIVTSRGDVHHVVTEYGVADLWGKSIRERALELIEVAHPDHRAELLAAAKARKFVFLDQRAPAVVSAYDAARRGVLRTGETVLVRAVLPSDEPAIQEIFYGLSSESSRQRFLGVHLLHPHSEMQSLVAVDDKTAVAFIVCLEDQVLGYGRAVNLAPGSLAEVDFVVREGWHGRGIGTLLFEALVAAARLRGAAKLEAFVMSQNAAMLRVLRKGELGAETVGSENGVHHLVVPLRGSAEPPSRSPC